MNFIPNAASAKVALTVLKAQKASPNIMFAAGVIGIVATAVTASKATLKAQPILDEYKVDKAHLEMHYLRTGDDQYDKKDLAKDKTLLLVQTAGKIVKIYAPPAILALTAISLLTGSHVVLTRRNAATTAAYATLDKAYREYRGRIKERLGEDDERELYRNVETTKVSVTDENGKKKQVNRKVSRGGSPYSLFYGEMFINNNPNPNWQRVPEMNVLQLRILQNQFNKQLQANGYLFLGDIFKEMGIPREGELGRAAQQVGWLKDSKNGDGFVDFGIFADDDLQRLLDFAQDGAEGIWLDFNVDGPILNLL